jgi:hypothetical protein
MRPRRLPLALLLALALAAEAPRAAVDLVLEARYQRPDGSWITFEVEDGDVLRSGNGLHMTLHLEAPRHVYLAMLGSSGEATLVLPPEGRNLPRPIPAGARLDLPPRGQFFRLDDNTGREAVFVVATAGPLGDPGRVVRILEAAGADHGAAARRLEALGDVEKVSFRHIAAEPLVGVDPGAADLLRAPDPDMLRMPRAGREGPAHTPQAPVFTVVPGDPGDANEEVLSEEGSLIPPGVGR